MNYFWLTHTLMVNAPSLFLDVNDPKSVLDLEEPSRLLCVVCRGPDRWVVSRPPRSTLTPTIFVVSVPDFAD